MKVLLRSNYQWVDANFDANSGAIRNANGDRIFESQMVAIENDERSKYVVCAGCGAILRNTKTTIAAHLKKGESSEACLSCMFLRHSNTVSGTNKYTRNSDGTYTVHATTKCNLTCGARYSSPEINSATARTHCRFAKCKSEGTKSFEDVFTKYPGAFDCVITVDSLDLTKWKLSRINSDSYTYKSTEKFDLYAIVNDKGIISNFRTRYRSSMYSFTYSKKYKKIFWYNTSTYSDDTTYPYTLISDARKNKLEKIMANIYEKEN